MRSFRPPLRLLGVALWAAGCRGQALAPPPADGTAAARPAKPHGPYGPAEEDESPPVKQEADETPEEAAEKARLIPIARQIDRVMRGSDCVSWIGEAGRDRKGQELLVVSREPKDCLVPAPPKPPGPFGSGRLDRQRAPRPPAPKQPPPEEESAASAETEEGEEGKCDPEKYYLVTRKGGQVRPVALLSDVCVFDQGVEGHFNDVHEVEVDKESHIFTEGFTSGRGSNLDTVSVAVGLDPLRIVKVTHSSWEGEETHSDDDGWDREAFAGTTSWTAVDCKAKARPAPAGDAVAPDGGSGKEPTNTIAGVWIPSADLPADFVAQGWRSTRLGACSALVDGKGTHGYTLHGEPGDATLRAVIGGGLLFVEISDDRFVGPGRNWVTDDHLELWVGDSNPSERVCGKDSTEWSAQWGIRVADGAVFPAHGAPQPLAGVERVVAGHTARFKIPLPDKGTRLTVVYSDSDDGRRQKSLIGTSELRFGDPATLGERYDTQQSCIVKGGTLSPKPAEPLKPSLTEAVTKDVH